MKFIAAIGILLLLPSVPAVYWCHSQETKQLREISLSRGQCRAEADEFAAMVVKMRDQAQFEKVRRDNPQALDRMRSQQKNRLLADIDDLSTGVLTAPANANMLYGNNWIDEVARYRSQQQNRDIILITSLIGAAFGVLLTGIAAVTAIIKTIMKLLSLPGLLMQKLRLRKGSRRIETNLPGQEKFTYVRSEADQTQQTAATASLLQEINTALGAQRALVENALGQINETVKAFKPEVDQSAMKAVDKQLGELITMIKEAAEPIDFDGLALKTANLVSSDMKQIRDSICNLPGSLEKLTTKGQDGLKEQTDRLCEAAQTTLKQTETISKTVDDFAAQFNAIRDYADYQQQRLARLEDGYDWNIIKHFCMRVIRCIDNLDFRIAQLENVGVNTEHLRHIREEFAFVLESSGVESFGARINSDYRGQENRIQVLDDRLPTDNPALAGKIAELVRPGYQCVLASDKIKIVRPAQVKLYSLSSENEGIRQYQSEHSGSFEIVKV